MKLLKQIALLVLASGSQIAYGTEVEQHDITIKHIVQPGENLHKITRSYLGTDILWQDNWKLNPQIENPHNLKIGQELTIIKERIIPAEKAKVFNVVNRVEKKPTDSEWLSAIEGDELVQQEGVRTYAKSSALLEFNDESQLKILEFSQIFLQSRSTGLTGTDSATIEVVKGDAELNWEPLEADQTEIIIVTGGTISKPHAMAGEVAELRTGITASGNSVISVYQGNSAVASAGSEVKVNQGMGLAVKPGQAPPEPKPLLKAPIVSDQIKNTLNYTNPWLKWSIVDGAVEYLVEICSDMNCQIILKQASVKTTQWQIEALNQTGVFFFRVAAKSMDELVGFRSKPQKIEFTTADDDVDAPVIAIDLSGHRSYANQQLTVGPDTRITVYASDELSGLAEIEFSWDGDVWQQYADQALDLPSGNSTLQIRATDQLGLTAEKSYEFINL